MEGSFYLTYLPHKVTLKDRFNGRDVNSMDDILDEHVIIEKWCRHNCEGIFAGYVSSWSFELESDAAHFKLVWA